jgi:GTP-binding protein EngB required for normal cell division
MLKILHFPLKHLGKQKTSSFLLQSIHFFIKKAFLLISPGMDTQKFRTAYLNNGMQFLNLFPASTLKKATFSFPYKRVISNNDIQMIDFLMRKQFCIVLTKCEKTPTEVINEMKQNISTALKHYSNFTSQIFITSTKSVKGMQNTDITEEIFDIFKNHINGI